MKKIICAILILSLFACARERGTSDSVNFPTSAAEKTQLVDALLVKTGIVRSDLQLYLRIFKQEQMVEVWGKATSKKTFQKIIEYPFCASSGQLGPKRKEGDRQIPEGFYHIDRFNPKSQFFLSLGLNYPNAADRLLGHPQWPGSDIFLHGACVTVGCVPLTDPLILELYLLATQAKSNGQEKIPVHIFPSHLTEKPWNKLLAQYPQHRDFWQQLRPAYLYFESNKKVPKVKIEADGRYVLAQ